MESQTKNKVISVAVRVFALVCTATAYYCTAIFLDNLDKNPLASYGIWGMASAVGISFAVIYLINDNKELDEAKDK